MCFTEKLVLMLMFLILSIPYKTLNGDKRNQGQTLASPYHYKSTSADSTGGPYFILYVLHCNTANSVNQLL